MMARLGSTFLGMILCASVVGCDSGGIPAGTPKDATGNVLPGGFEDMAKRTGGAMTKGGPAATVPAKEAPKDVVKKDAPKDASKDMDKKDAPKDAPKETTKETPK